MRLTRLVAAFLAIAVWLLFSLAMLLILSRFFLSFQLETAQAQPSVRAAVAQGRPFETDAAALRFVDSSNTPIAKRDLWVLCYADNSAQTLVGQQWVRTDTLGRLQAPLPDSCLWIAALLQKYEQPSTKPEHGPVFWVFAVSWPTNSSTPASASSCNTILCAAGGDVIIRDEWPLVLFNVVAALEWEPEPGSEFVGQLTRGLRAASLYLADLTDGAMAFGPATIHTGGRNWAGADLRVQVANDLRPAAYVGGIVTQTTAYSPTDLPVEVFRPAAIFLGRAWNRDGAFAGAWDKPDGYRTIVHEWGHYALFLHDEYQTNVGRPIYCIREDIKTTPDEGAASAMAWHYTASELWHPDDFQTPAAICTATDQYRRQGHSDWETLADWSAIAGVPFPVLSIPGKAPASGMAVETIALLEVLFGQSPAERSRLYAPLITTSGAALPAPVRKTLMVRTADSLPTTLTQTSQVYLLQGGSVTPTHILYQGAASGGSGSFGEVGEITLLGVHAGDDLRLFVDRYAYQKTPTEQIPGGRFVYPASQESADLNATAVVAQASNVSATLNLRFGMMSEGDNPAKLTRLKVEVQVSGTLQLQNPMAQVCVPDAAIGCPAAWRSALVTDTTGLWFADFAPLANMQELPLYAVVRVTASNPEFGKLIRWFRDAGGVGPGHKPTNAPVSESATLSEGAATVQTLDAMPMTEPCNRLLIMPAASGAALLTAPDVGVQIVGTPLDLDILFGAITPDQTGKPLCQTTGKRDLRLTLFYHQAELARLGISEAEEASHLVIFHYAGANGWEKASSFVDADLNWVATTIRADGIYAIAYIP